MLLVMLDILVLLYFIRSVCKQIVELYEVFSSLILTMCVPSARHCISADLASKVFQCQ
jgi:hypothetical protein